MISHIETPSDGHQNHRPPPHRGAGELQSRNRRNMRMKIERYEKGSFAVIGKEGSTTDGTGFIQRLWEDANSHFEEIQHLAKKGRDGTIAGIWGAMSDFSRTFNPWEDFSRGLYLAGVECELDAEAPDGWTKWIVPGYEYISAACETEHTIFRYDSIFTRTQSDAGRRCPGLHLPADRNQLYALSIRKL